MTIRISRRRFFGAAGIGMIGICSADRLCAAEANIKMSTYVYKRVGDLDIKLDVHRADDDQLRPTAVWIHGGALINGGRSGISRRVKKDLLDAGYGLISIDYRLAPETKLPEIIRDVEDAFAWIRTEAAGRANLDTRRIAVLGGSAGGYLTLTSGFRVQPRPTVLVSFWGYGDLIGDWYSQPSPHPRHHRSKLSNEDAFRQVSGPAISNPQDRSGNGGAFYQYCRQQGIWPFEISGWDPHQEPKRFYPYMPVKNVTEAYPPTILIHGTEDTDVPFEQSLMMAEQLKQHAVEHRLISIPGGEHGLGGGNQDRIDKAYADAMKFVEQYMRE